MFQMSILISESRPETFESVGRVFRHPGVGERGSNNGSDKNTKVITAHKCREVCVKRMRCDARYA